MAVAAPGPVEILMPTSRAEAVEAFGDGAGLTVVAGGTIVMPLITYGRLKPSRALVLTRAGLAGIRRDGGTITIGAATPVAALVGGAPEPLASAASGVADLEVRSQGTVGGNLCAPAGAEYPRGDLQAPLIALGARVRSAGAGGERTESVEELLAGGTAGRLVLELELDDPAAGSYAALHRPHAHSYTPLSVAACRVSDGSTRLAVGGAGPHGRRLLSAERAFAEAGDPDAAGAAAVRDAAFADDAMASAWYREQMLPVLVRRALNELQENA